MSGKNCVVALAGNPNVGKSTVFNTLTGLRQHTGNWAGKTVETARGRYDFEGGSYELVDLPGTYSLSAGSPEEEVARDFICSGEAGAVVIVCSALSLERNLYLVLQTLELTQSIVVCVNMCDEARRAGLEMDLPKLERQLGVPVCATSAREGEGMQELMAAIADVCAKGTECCGGEACNGCFGHSYCAFCAHSRDAIPKDCPPETEERVAARYARAAELCSAISQKQGKRRNRDIRLDSILTRRSTGLPVMLALLALVLFITAIGANYPSALLSSAFSAAEPYFAEALAALHAPDWLSGVLVGGVYRVLTWVVAVMLPPMAIFFPLFTLLEDFGYLPRVAFNMDNIFRRCGGCGKQAITMTLALGCNAVCVTGCRIIASPRERLIAILTNAFIPCNGRLPALITITAVFFAAGAETPVLSALISGGMLTAVILAGIGMTLLCSHILSRTLLRGEPSSFSLELPPYRAPKVGRVIARSLLDRTVFVLLRAIKVAAPAGAVIWLLANISVGGDTLLAHCAAFLDPFGQLMGLDGVILLAFILGFPANEIVLPLALMAYMQTGTISEFSVPALAETLIANGWTWLTALCTMLFSLMHWPCGTTCLTIKKETGSLKWTLLSALIPTLCGILICTLVAASVRMFGLI